MKYAKLAAPEARHLQPRERLNAQLDRLLAQHRAVWIAGPPGAGKTALAATWLTACGRPAIWCRLDRGDLDPATLGRHLTAAGPAAAQPGTGPQGLDAAFLRGWYAALARGSVLVLDDVHELTGPGGSELVRALVAELPEHVSLLLLARAEPPAALAKLQVGRQLGLLGWNALRATPDEARALLGAAAGLADGWAAAAAWAELPREAQRARAYAYLDAEVFGALDPDERDLLMRLAVLPPVPVAALRALVGPDGAERVGRLCEQVLFLGRPDAHGGRTQLFGLFRSFLAARAADRWDRSELAAWWRHAGDAHAAADAFEEACALYLQAAAADALAALLLAQAEPMVTCGRGRIWRAWAARLPHEPSAAPGLAYWLGVALLDSEPLQARSQLVQAAIAFLQSGHADAALRCAACIVDSFDLCWGPAQQLAPWREWLQDALRAPEAEALPPALRALAGSRLVLAMLLATPSDPELPAIAAATARLLPLAEAGADKLGAGAILLRYFAGAADPDPALALIRALGPLGLDAGLPAGARVRWLGQVVRWHGARGELAAADEALAQLEASVAPRRIDPLWAQLPAAGLRLAAGDLAGTRALLDRARAGLPSLPGAAWLEWRTLDAQAHALSGDLAQAASSARQCLAQAQAAGLAGGGLERVETLLGALLAHAGQAAAADQCFASAEAHAHGHARALVRESRLFADAVHAFAQQDNEGGAALLARALGQHRARQGYTLFDCLPPFASRVAGLALAHDIAADDVRVMVLRQGLRALDRLTPNWPWPVCVRTLGRFTVSLYGEAVATSGRAQQRPLELLRVLAAEPEASRHQSTLFQLLWPDAEDPKSALTITVHRLRKLLGGDDRVVVTAGETRLDGELVWTDVAQLAALCDRVGQMTEASPAAEMKQAAAHLLDLYRGPFCDGYEEAWVVAAALRWKTRFVGACATLGLLLEHAAQWQAAAALYQRALDAEPLAEQLYRGLMRCASALDDTGTALSTYRRCKEMLSIVLGQTPSSETLKLASQLGFRV